MNYHVTGRRPLHLGTQLGPMHSESFEKDPKHLGFVLARYHFVARMLQGSRRVLEIGAGEGTGARVVRPSVGELVLTDPEPLGPDVIRCDIAETPIYGCDAVYMLDVLEHVAPESERKFLEAACVCLKEHGVMIVGSPSLESQVYASELSRRHHVNCKTEDGLRETMLCHFRNVFMFGMNDSTLHTGFGPMCHYRLALCAGKR